MNDLKDLKRGGIEEGMGNKVLKKGANWVTGWVPSKAGAGIPLRTMIQLKQHLKPTPVSILIKNKESARSYGSIHTNSFGYYKNKHQLNIFKFVEETFSKKEQVTQDFQ